MLFRGKKDGTRSGSFARHRIGDLLISERLDCSPQMIAALKHEIIHAARKYISIEEQDVSLWITEEPAALHIRLPLQRKQEKRDAKTI